MVIKPPRLQLGDTIGIVAPCLPVLPSFRENYERGKQALGTMGFRLKEGKTIGLQHWYSAGTPRQQADDINAMFADPEVKALVASSGGHSAIGVLEHLDYNLIRRHPKPFIGMSDMTMYHLALYAQTGLVGFHMDEVVWGIGWNWNREEFKQTTPIKNLYQQILTEATPISPVPSFRQREVWRPGKTEGHLVGGTLPLVSYLIGTPYCPEPSDFADAILFWEVTGRPKYEIRRMLFQLKYAGVFDKLSGMLIGTLSDIPPAADSELVEPDIRDIVMEVMEEYDFPVMAGLDFGHYTVNAPMPLGVKAQFDTVDLSFGLKEGAVY